MPIADQMTNRLIEPLALLHGAAARAACAGGLALPLAGGPTAFALCRLIEDDRRRIVPVRDIMQHGLKSWSPILDRIVAAPPTAGLPRGPLVMGILNATPDSFSDGGRNIGRARGTAAGLLMAEQGAALVDVGGESTRPDATPVAPEIEQARILAIVRDLAGQGITVSVDTRHASTMQAALAAGAAVVNDVSALSHDPAASAVVAQAGCPVVLMHMRGTPESMAGLADYDDVAIDTVRELQARIAAAEQAGIARDRIVVDPGIGFAKDAAHSLELLRRLPILANLGCRVLLGVSRKGFIGRFGQAHEERDPAARLPGSIVAALPALALADSILRVHDVAETVQAVRLWQAMQG